MKTAVKFLIALVLSLLLAWAVRTYVFTIFSVPQGGLPPQLKAGNRVIVNRIDCENFGRGDVVVFTDTVVYQPKNQRRKRVFESHFIGRIEKLPGDTLRIVFIGDPEAPGGALDACPCIGEHVAHTAECGTFVWVSHEWKPDDGGVLRIRFKLGK